MQSTVLDNHTPKTYLIVFDPGEEVMKGLLVFVKERCGRPCMAELQPDIATRTRFFTPGCWHRATLKLSPQSF